MSKNGGIKHDLGKDPWHLLPWDAVQAITKVLLFGATKYAPRNWEKGMDWSRIYRAAIGHLTAWYVRDPADKETGFSHLWHAGCCILFLIAYELRGVGKDDRPEIVRAGFSKFRQDTPKADEVASTLEKKETQ